MIRLFIFIMTLPALCSALVDEPAGCWRSLKLPCALKTSRQTEIIRWQEADISAAPETYWVLSSTGLRLLSGHLWIQSAQQLSVESSFVKVLAKGEFWISHVENQSEIKNLNAELTLKHGGKEPSLTLPVGFENWYSGIDSQGVWVAGTLRALSQTQFFDLWIRKMKIGRQEATDKIALWKALWKRNVELSAEIYSESARRQILEDQNRQKSMSEASKEHEDENKMLRRMYRAKNGLLELGP